MFHVGGKNTELWPYAELWPLEYAAYLVFCGLYKM